MQPSLTTAPTLRLCSQCGTRETDDQLRITRGTTCGTCGRCYGCGGLVGCTCRMDLTSRPGGTTWAHVPLRVDLALNDEPIDVYAAQELPPMHDLGGEGG